MFKHERHPDWPSDCIYAVFDHQTGKEVERGFTFEEAQDKIDELLNANPAPDVPVEYAAYDREASRADELYDRNREGW